MALSEVRIDPATRKPTVRVQLSTLDDAGATPIDRKGVSMSIVLSKVSPVTLASTGGSAAGPYVAYLARTATQQQTEAYPIPDGTPPRVVQQPTAENTNTGTFTQRAVGDYDYTFFNALPADYDPAAAHVMAIYATRTVGSIRYVGNADHAFVPATPGTTPPVRDIVHTATCNGCHNPLQAHGGSRQSVQLCLTCHTQGAVDPESNNSIDFNVMLHKIHMGKHLPSVVAGKPYSIVGNSLSVHDWSHAGFPQPIANCQSCHTATDSDRWVTNATREACMSCHENVSDPNAMAMGAHPFPVPLEAVCGSCHSSTTNTARDAREAHVVPLNNPLTPALSVEILSVTVASPDDPPAVRIKALTGTRAAPPATPVTNPAAFSWLEAQINGPNTGYVLNAYNLVRVPKEMLVNLVADPAVPGEFTFSLPRSLRALVGTVGDPETDSYTLSIRPQYDPTPGAQPDNDKVDQLTNPTKEFGAGEVVTPRAPVADTAKCNSCHGALTMHGTYALAKNTEQCALCHTSTFDTRVRQGANKQAGPTTSLRLSTMVHRIHGTSIAERPYKLYGYAAMAPFPIVDFSEIGFPGDTRDCTKCHFTTPELTYTLPLPEGDPPSQLVELDADGGVVGGQ